MKLFDPIRTVFINLRQKWGMPKMTRHDPHGWLDQMFSAKAVQSGGVIRRSVATVEREIGRELLLEEVERRGFHLIECGGQMVVICNGGRIRIHL